MPKCTPLPDYSGEDVYIIGGGPSLRVFDFSLLHNKNTIGCNHAYVLGERVCHICCFGDWPFFNSEHRELAKFDGWVVTNYEMPMKMDWLCQFNKSPRVGRNKQEGLVWATNTGETAINLALVLGAKRVFLLGFDMNKMADGTTHWHDQPLENQGEEQYVKFAGGFGIFANDVKSVFPDREIINITEGSSRLRMFPTCSFADANLIPTRQLVEV
jgi:hypothetical protein